MRNSYLIFGSPDIREEEIQEVVDSLRSGWLSKGPKVDAFEENFRAYIGSTHAVSLNSCTAGLHLSMLAAGITADDEVITTPMTFGATSNTILHAGAKPIFVDIDPATQNIDTSKIEEKITSKTKAIMPVHYAGRPCDMNAIHAIAKKYNLLVIEDAAHAVGAEYYGKKIGSLSDLTVFSFYVTKNLVTGEGGMVTTANADLAEKIQILALHGMSKGAWKRYSDDGYAHYQIVLPGYKYNMLDIQAAMGIHQLRRLEQGLVRRKEVWERYDAAFADLPVTLPAAEEPHTRHARHLYTLLLDLDKLTINRDQFLNLMHKKNIGTGVHFIAVHLHPYYANTFGYKRGDFPNAEFVSDRTVSLPLSTKLTDDDVMDVIETVRSILLSATK